MRGTATTARVSERMSVQLSRETCSEMHSEMQYNAAAPRASRSAHSMRRAPRGARRMERADCDTRNAASMEC
eukprot:7377314-Lingulodinium_polyedra.AAC.1